MNNNQRVRAMGLVTIFLQDSVNWPLWYQQISTRVFISLPYRTLFKRTLNRRLRPQRSF